MTSHYSITGIEISHRGIRAYKSTDAVEIKVAVDNSSLKVGYPSIPPLAEFSASGTPLVSTQPIGFSYIEPEIEFELCDTGHITVTLLHLGKQFSHEVSAAELSQIKHCEEKTLSWLMTDTRDVYDVSSLPVVNGKRIAGNLVLDVMRFVSEEPQLQPASSNATGSPALQPSPSSSVPSNVFIPGKPTSLPLADQRSTISSLLVEPASPTVTTSTVTATISTSTTSSSSNVLFKLPSFEHDTSSGPNPWSISTPTLEPISTTYSNSIGTIPHVRQYSTDSETPKDLPPRVTTLDLPIALSSMRFSRIAASAFGAIAIAEDGSLHYWIRNSSLSSFSEGGPVPGFTGSVIVDIAAGHDHFLALTADSILYAWGANQYHQCSPESTSRIHTPIKVSNKPIIACSAGGHSSLCIDSNGVVYTWGQACTSLTVPIDSNLVQSALFSSPTNAFASSSPPAPSLPANSSTRPNAPRSHCTISVDSLCHGVEMARNRADARFVSEMTSIWLPEDLSFVQASVSASMTVLVARDGSVWAWGDANAICGSTGDSVSLTPVCIPLPEGTCIVRALAGDIHALALDSAGRLWSWGNRFIGGRLIKDANPHPEPYVVTLPHQSPVIDFGIAQDQSIAVTDAHIYKWTSFSKPIHVESVGDGVTLAVGVGHGPSCSVSYIILGTASGSNKIYSEHDHSASQTYNLEDMDESDIYDVETADESSSTIDST